MALYKILIDQGDFLYSFAMNYCKTNQGKSVKKFENCPVTFIHQIGDKAIALICGVYWKYRLMYQKH